MPGIAAYVLVAISAFTVGAAPLALLGVLIFSIPALIALQVRCPHCGKPVVGRRVQIAGYEVYSWSGLPSKRCADCGNRLDIPAKAKVGA